MHCPLSSSYSSPFPIYSFKTHHTKPNITLIMNGTLPDHHTWPQPTLSYGKAVRDLHATIQTDWDSVKQSACQTAAGRALWNHVVHDPLAELFAGETYLKNLYEKIKKDRLNNAKEVSGVILAVRTLWFDSKLELAVNSFGGGAQVVLLGAGLSSCILTYTIVTYLHEEYMNCAGMDTRAYRLDYLKECDVYEIDFAEVMQMKDTLLQAAMDLSR